MPRTLLVVVALGACRPGPTTPTPPTPPAPDPSGTVVILHTSDEHGWLEPEVADGVVHGGPAVIAALWEAEERSRDTHLVLSGGDSALGGPSISRAFEGQPTIEVMNAMQYDAAVVGNHELDEGLEVFGALADASDFPWLAANATVDGEPFPGTAPTATFVRDGITVGVVGVLGGHTPTSAPPVHTAGLDVRGSDAVDASVRDLRDAGAHVVVVLSHACAGEAQELLVAMQEPVDLWLAGHCHAVGDQRVDGTPVVSSGVAWKGFSRVTVSVADGTVGEAEVVWVEPTWPEGGQPPVVPDPTVTGIVSQWAAAVDVLLGEAIGHTVTGIPREGWTQANWFTDAWLDALPDVDIALLNFGALRQDVPAGEITLRSLHDLAPFDNDIVVLELTGQQLRTVVREESPAIAGATWMQGLTAATVLLPDGQPVGPDTTYRVATTDYLASGGSDTSLPAFDDTWEPTGLNYRDPAIAWTRALHTSPADPLEDHLDPAPRGQ